MTWYNKILTGVAVAATGYVLTELPSCMNRTLRISVGDITICIGKECQEKDYIDHKASKEENYKNKENVFGRLYDNITYPKSSLLQEESKIIIYASKDDGTDIKFLVPSFEYTKLKNKNHRIIWATEYLRYVTYKDPTVQLIAKELTKQSTSREEAAQSILNFVHQQMYDASIEPSRDYVKYPLETLVERNGDCEDLAILGAALLKAVDINVALLNYTGEKGKMGHEALGIEGNFEGTHYVVDGVKYYYAEATGTDWLTQKATWKIGQVPDEFKMKEAEVIVVK